MLISDGKEFKSVVKGENFMTPQIKGYWQTGDYQCELSFGYGIGGGKLYGVTVVNTTTMTHESGLGKVFESRKEALAYINVLGK